MQRTFMFGWMTLAAALLLAGCEQAPNGGSTETIPSQAEDEALHKNSATEAPVPEESTPPESSGTEEEEQEEGTLLTTLDGHYRLRYVSDPDPIPLNELVSFTVTIEQPYRVKTQDVTLRVDAAMPDHGHGMNTEPRVTPLGEGRFLAEGLLLHMAGRWEVYFDVTLDGVTERAQFELELE